MNQTQQTHTPGPWNVSVNFPDGKTPTYYVAQDAPPGVVCLWPVASSGIASKADAHLIAAAPDMLATLKRVRDAIAWSNSSDRMDDSEIIDLIDGALRKAQNQF